ncbi:MAG: hypothetical protein OEY52_01000 [Gammaproteobacteria bacterium]|nr:hypothetical protein [Gammaproteobacteria bacterium]
MQQSKPHLPVLLCSELPQGDLQTLLSAYDMQIELVEDMQAIPGSFWGESEAGLIDNRLLIRQDTPVHSALHEACHYICMDQSRRAGLHTDAGGDYDEENGVCYLQILLADELEGMDAQRMMDDMDSWGYSFRLGSAAQWFKSDAEDAAKWLIQHGLLNSEGRPSWQLRK